MTHNVLKDSQGQVWGSYFLFRDYRATLWVTVTLEGTPTLQPFFDFVPPGGGTGPSSTLSVSLMPNFDLDFPAA